jgi:uncharacterized SAM-binding protein YcdF (DUF218 family)
VIFGPIKLVLRLASLLLTVLILYFAVTFVQIWWRGHEHSSASAQAILVFGTTEDNGIASPELKVRLNQALSLYKQGRAPWIVVTGGNLPGDVYTEAGVSATYLEHHGVAASHIVKGAGNDTWQNVQTVIKKLKKRNIHTVITVTDPFHEFRAMAIASAQGLQPYPSPVPDSPTIKHQLWRYYLKETLAVGVGRVVGFGRLSSWTTKTSKIHVGGVHLPTIHLPSGN